MRISILITILVFSCNIFSTTYYLSSKGADTGSADAATPWKTIERLNQVTLSAGDSVLFNKGDTFPGGVVIKGSGQVNNPIYYGSYGSGIKPVITGAVKIISWTSRGNGLYAAPLTQRPSMVAYDGKPLMLARSPNKGYYTVTAVVDSMTRFTDSSANSSIDWIGARAQIRTSNWTVHTKKVTAFDGASKTFTVSAIPSYPTGYKILKGWGYFLNDHVAALDTAGEWFFDSSAQEILLRTPDGTNPTAHIVTGSVLSHGFYCYGSTTYNYIVIDGLEISQFATMGIKILGSGNKINNCNLKFNEQKGIEIYNGTSNHVVGNVIYGTNGVGINMQGGNSVIERNTITAIALFDRLNGYGIQLGYAALSIGTGNVIRLNRIDSVGYIGLLFDGVNHLVEKNFIQNVCLVNDDGGGTYCANRNFPTNQGVVGSIIRDNIILSSKGNGAGSEKLDSRPANGIYLDDFTHDVTVTGNTVAYCSGWGYMMHNSVDCRIINNVSVGCSGAQIYMQQDAIMYSDSMRNNRIVKNSFCSVNESQRAIYIASHLNRFLFGVHDSNSYWNPFVGAPIDAPGGPYTLAHWRSVSGQDLSTKEAPVKWNGFKVTDTTGSELILNGTLDVNTTSWRIWSSSGTCTIARDTGKGFEGGSLRVNCPGQTSLASSSSISMVKDQKYLVRFSIRGTKSSSSYVFVRQNGSPSYNPVGLSKLVTIDSSKRTYSLLFTATETNSNCRLDFQNMLTDSVYWIDNISVRAVNAVIPNPSEQVLLFVNPTEQDSTVTLPEFLYTLDGVKAPRSVILRPFGSAVYYKDSVAGSTLIEAVDLNTDFKAEIYPNPFNPAADIFVNGVWGTVKADVFSADGRIVSSMEKASCSGAAVLSWNGASLPSGMYLFRIYSGKQMAIRKAVLLK